MEKSSDEGENPRAYKKRHNREIDNIFRANGWLQSQTAGSKSYDRGYVWNFEWCSEDPEKAQPERVARVQKLMALDWTFDEAFDRVSGHPENEPLPDEKSCLCGA
jgi:hypothetical protein